MLTIIVYKLFVLSYNPINLLKKERFVDVNKMSSVFPEHSDEL